MQTLTARTGAMCTLRTACGDYFDVYVSGSAEAQRGILIVHEWWGLKEHNLDWADRFADLGYRAMAIDLYDGRRTDDADEASQWMRELDQDLTDSKLQAALDTLRLAGRKLATYGCSMGGRQAMIATLLEPDSVAATVVAYSRMETDLAKLQTLAGPVLAIYAQQESTWPDKQQRFEAAMAQAGKHTEAVCFDAAHGFTNPASPRYQPAADRAAWQATVAFLDRYLSPHPRA